MTDQQHDNSTHRLGRLLLIEDSQVQAREIAIFLQSAGYEVVTAGDGESGLEQLAAGDFDLLLCDLYLPGMTGFEVCRKVKAGRVCPIVPVVLITRWADPFNVLKGLEAGADGFVSKGQRHSEIVERVQRVLNRTHGHQTVDDDPVRVVFLDTEFQLTAEREQLLEVILSGFQDTVFLNEKFESEMKERLRAEAAAHEKDARLRTLFNEAVDGILTLDSHGVIQSLNPAAERIFCTSADELVGSDVACLLTPSHSDEHDEQIATYLHTKDHGLIGCIQQFVGRRNGGDKFPLEICVNEINTAGETLFTAFVRDITERVKADQEVKSLAEDLKRSNGDLEQFAYVISHDLKEPLRTVTSFTKLLAEEMQGDLSEDSQRFMAYILEGATRMQKMIDDLLNYSRVGRTDTQVEMTNLNDLVQETLHSLGKAIDDAHANIRVEPLPTLKGTPSLLMRLFQNLISNAIKFRGERDPEIVVEADDMGDYWQFAVRDNGIGIAPQHVERVFQIFQRLHARDEYEGTGVGLAVCRKIVEHHGGQIWIESEPGQGSTFYFTIRAVPAESSQDRREPQQHALCTSDC